MTATKAARLAKAVATYNETVTAAAAALGFPHPVGAVRWVHIDQVQANDYNPNSVALNELRLLASSIQADGYTQPVVAIWDETLARYVIVDGFHRFLLMRTQPAVYATTQGYLPVVVIDRTPAERMASTVRHNRARGKHSIAGMSNLVLAMLDEGLADEDVCQALGLEPQELLRLKHVSGFAKLLENHEYQRSWELKRQLYVKAQWVAAHPDDPPTI